MITKFSQRLWLPPHYYRAWTNFSFQDRRYWKPSVPSRPTWAGFFPFPVRTAMAATARWRTPDVRGGATNTISKVIKLVVLEFARGQLSVVGLLGRRRGGGRFGVVWAYESTHVRGMAAAATCFFLSTAAIGTNSTNSSNVKLVGLVGIAVALFVAWLFVWCPTFARLVPVSWWVYYGWVMQILWRR